jgi:hypothetical protein
MQLLTPERGTHTGGVPKCGCNEARCIWPQTLDACTSISSLHRWEPKLPIGSLMLLLLLLSWRTTTTTSVQHRWQCYVMVGRKEGAPLTWRAPAPFEGSARTTPAPRDPHRSPAAPSPACPARRCPPPERASPPAWAPGCSHACWECCSRASPRTAAGSGASQDFPRLVRSFDLTGGSELGSGSG